MVLAKYQTTQETIELELVIIPSRLQENVLHPQQRYFLIFELKTKGLYCLAQTKHSIIYTVGVQIIIGWMDGWTTLPTESDYLRIPNLVVNLTKFNKMNS